MRIERELCGGGRESSRRTSVARVARSSSAHVISIQTRANRVNRICLRPRRSNVSVRSPGDVKFSS